MKSGEKWLFYVLSWINSSNQHYLEVQRRLTLKMSKPVDNSQGPLDIFTSKQNT